MKLVHFSTAKRLGRSLRWGVLICWLCVVASSSALWIRGTDWIRLSDAFTRSERSAGAIALSDVGLHSIGLYSHDGRLGVVDLESGIQGLEAEEVSLVGPVGPDETGWHWTRTGRMDDYTGGIPDDLIPTWVSEKIPYCAYLCTGEDHGMRHFQRIHAVMVNIPILLAILLMPGALYGWKILRNRRKRLAGRCMRCGYDLRATPERCPECGGEPAVSSETAVVMAGAEQEK